MIRNLQDASGAKINENGESIALHKNRNLVVEPNALSNASTPRRAFGDLRNHLTTPRPSDKRLAFQKSTSLRPKVIAFNAMPILAKPSIPVMEWSAEDKTKDEVEPAPAQSNVARSIVGQRVHSENMATPWLAERDQESRNSWSEDAPAEFMPADLSGVIISPIKLNSSVHLFEDMATSEDNKENLEDLDEIPPVEQPYMGGNRANPEDDLPERELIPLVGGVVVYAQNLAQRFMDALKVDGGDVLNETSGESEFSDNPEPEVRDAAEVECMSFDEFTPQEGTPYQSYEDLNKSADPRFDFF